MSKNDSKKIRDKIYGKKMRIWEDGEHFPASQNVAGRKETKKMGEKKKKKSEKYPGFGDGNGKGV